MQPVKPPLKVRRQLGIELRSIRTLAGMTQRALAARIEMNQPRIKRAEYGETLLSKPQVQAWLAATGADEAVRERVLTLTEAAHTETWPWQAGLSGGHLQDVAASDENDAVLIRDYAMQWMPGLVQTAAYARALLPQVDPTGEMDYPAAVAARMERQQALYREGIRFGFLFEEAALRWSPADAVMPAQWDRLVSVATLDSVEIAVLPSMRVGASGWHAFTLCESTEGTTYVTTELLHGGQVVTDPESVAVYEALWKRLWEAAVTGDEAVALIRSLGS